MGAPTDRMRMVQKAIFENKNRQTVHIPSTHKTLPLSVMDKLKDLKQINEPIQKNKPHHRKMRKDAWGGHLIWQEIKKDVVFYILSSC